jgi:hypothetical protein
MPSKRKRGPDIPPYRVLRDSREQLGWLFPESEACSGTEVVTLETGDYTLAGHEHRFAIERKGSMGEFSANLWQPRFENELTRLDQFDHAYLLLEFTMEEIISFPQGSGIPQHKWRFLRPTPQALLKRFHEMCLAHPKLNVLFVGHRGREVASSLFKRITERYGK